MNDTVYDHEYELRTEGLDNLSEDIETAFNNLVERLQRHHDERDALISELLTPIGNKSEDIANLLQGVVNANGLVVEITDKDNSLKANLISAESIQALDEFSDSILNFKDFNASTELTKIAEQLTNISNLDTSSIYSAIYGTIKDFEKAYTELMGIETTNTDYSDVGKKPSGGSLVTNEEAKHSSATNKKGGNKGTGNNNTSKPKVKVHSITSDLGYPTGLTKTEKQNYKTRIDNYLSRNGKKYNKKSNYGEFNAALGKKTGFVLDADHREALAKHLGVIYNNDKKSGTLYKFFKEIGYFATGSKRIPKDMLGVTQDGGQEVIFRKSDGAMLTPLGKGDKVFTAQMTDNLWKLAQSASVSNGLSELSAPIINNVNTSSPTININFENFMNVEGNVDENAITDIRKFKSEMVDEFTKTMTNEMNLLGHKFRF